MDVRIRRFRKRAEAENRGRRGVSRRYSPELRQEAVSYWLSRRGGGETLQKVAGDLGVNPWSLQRWANQNRERAGFREIQVVASEPVGEVSSEPNRCVVVTPEGFRVEGLDLTGVVHVLGALR